MAPQASKKQEQRAIDGELLLEGDFVIPVMGPTGAGKSSFINLFLEQDRMVVGDVEPCTSEPAAVVIDASKLPVDMVLTNRRLVLLDTPGFNTDRDSEILKQIADWLKDAYNQKVVIGGVIYLHDITHDRFTSSAKQNLEIFRCLCGAGSLGNVIIGTTKWDRLINSKEGEKHEADMKGKHWKPMIAKGTKVHQIRSDSPWELVKDILESPNQGTILQIQREIAVEKKKVQDTEAGKQCRVPSGRISKRQRLSFSFQFFRW